MYFATLGNQLCTLPYIYNHPTIIEKIVKRNKIYPVSLGTDRFTRKSEYKEANQRAKLAISIVSKLQSKKHRPQATLAETHG